MTSCQSTHLSVKTFSFVTLRNPMWSCTLIVLLLISAVRTIEVTPNSPCSPFCLNNIASNPSEDRSSLTLSANVPCDDWEIVGPSRTVRGRQWFDCLNCEKTSDAIDIGTRQNDVYWLLCGWPSAPHGRVQLSELRADAVWKQSTSSSPSFGVCLDIPTIPIFCPPTRNAPKYARARTTAPREP